MPPHRRTVSRDPYSRHSFLPRKPGGLEGGAPPADPSSRQSARCTLPGCRRFGWGFMWFFQGFLGGFLRCFFRSLGALECLGHILICPFPSPPFSGLFCRRVSRGGSPRGRHCQSLRFWNTRAFGFCPKKPKSLVRKPYFCDVGSALFADRCNEKSLWNCTLQAGSSVRCLRNCTLSPGLWSRLLFLFSQKQKGFS